VSGESWALTSSKANVVLVTNFRIDAMKTWSLKIRLLWLAAIAISLVLGAAGLGFNWLYRQHVEKFALTELTMHMNQLLADVVVTPEGIVRYDARLSDPRFEEPGGGLYWQIDVKGQQSLRSRSLWDEAITVPTPPESTEEDHAHNLTLPSGGEVFALEKLVAITSDNGIEKNVVVTVGLDRERVTSPVAEFLNVMLLGLAATYVTLLGATFAIITLGLRPLHAVKHGIANLRSGQGRFETANLPVEVTPLAEEVNALVEAREQQLERARQRASNLAHGLKTPLAVMFAVANDLDAQDQHSASDSIILNASQMRDLVDRELTRSRMADGINNHRSNFSAVLERVLATMRKAPRGELLAWNTALPPNMFVAMDSVDLMELLGNLLDNARKHAREFVRISHDRKSLTVEDDGLGVSEEQLPLILKRGVRLDEKTAGSGIGLAIVSDLADVYGLTLEVRRSDLGGLAIIVGLPAV
jgi:signal transduction histidine kinase